MSIHLLECITLHKLLGDRKYDIDGLHGCRTRAFTDVLLDTLDSKTLWDEYGIDDDILVCTTNLQLLITLFSDCELVALYS